MVVLDGGIVVAVAVAVVVVVVVVVSMLHTTGRQV